MDSQITVATATTSQIAAIPSAEIAVILPSNGKSKPRKPRATLAERHAAKTDKSGGLFACWPWVGSKATDGYGKFGGGADTRPAHIVAWELVNGPIPEGMVIRHKCNCPSCQNVACMELGTHADNMADMVKAGRQQKGKTPVATVKRAAYLAVIEGMKAPAIAAKLNIGHGTARGILRGETYQKITGIPRNQATTKGRDLASLLSPEQIETIRGWKNSRARRAAVKPASSARTLH